MKEVFAFIGFPLQMEVYLDSSAAQLVACFSARELGGSGTWR